MFSSKILEWLLVGMVGFWIGVIAASCAPKRTSSVTIVTCSNYVHAPVAMKVREFNKEADGFSGIDPEGKRQYYMKDVNETCWTMSEMEFDKAKAAGR